MIRKRLVLFWLIFLALAVSSFAIQNTIFSDVDNDGDLDFYLEVLIRTQNHYNFYYLNGTDGIGNIANVKQGYFVDMNSDGFEDLYIVRRGAPNYLYYRTGNVRFTNMTSTWQGQNLTGSAASPLAAAFDDFNNNGIVDAFVNGNLFLDINSSLTFLNATNISNIDELPALKQVKIEDLNLDGNKDIIGVAQNGSLVIFLSFGDSNNDGCPEFFDATADMKLDNIRGVNFAESDNIITGIAVNQSLGFFPYSGVQFPFVADNFSDIYLARNSSNRLFIQLFPETRLDFKAFNQSMFYIPSWLERSQDVNDSSNSTGVIFADFDNNTATDLFIANGNPFSQLFFRNGSSWNDEFINQSLNFSVIANAKLAQAADVDNDGLLDIAYIDASAILTGENLVPGTATFNVSPASNGSIEHDVQENQVLVDSILNMEELATTPAPACPDCTAGTVVVSNAGHLLWGAGAMAFVNRVPTEAPPAPVGRGGGGGGASFVSVPGVNISEIEIAPASSFPEVEEKPSIEPEAPVITPPIAEKEGLPMPSCGNDTGIFIPGLGVITESDKFDYLEQGIRIAETGVLIQSKGIRYAGPRVDFRKLDLRFGEQVVFCKQPKDLFSQFKPYFLVFDPDMFVSYFTKPTKIGKSTAAAISASCTCANGAKAQLASWIARKHVATSKGIFEFDSREPFEKNKVVEACLPSAGFPAGVLLSMTELLTDRLSGRAGTAAACGIVGGTCTPYHNCSITAPLNYNGEHIHDIELPPNYVFATSVFTVPSCGGAVDASIVFPEGFEAVKLYRMTEHGYDEVPYTLSDGLVCDARSWKDVVDETKEVAEPENSSLVKVYDNGDEAILLVHGLFSSSATFDQLIEELEYTHQPYSVYVYDYSSSAGQTFEGAVDALAEELDRLNVGSLTIFAHSLGGLISEKALMKLSDQKSNALAKVKRIVLAGTPHKGSKGLKNLDIVSSLLASTPLASFPASEDFINAALNGVPTEKVPGIDYVVFAGDKSSLLTSKLLQKEPNDGLVTVSSAKAIGAKDYYEFGLSHMALPDSTESISELFRIIGKGKESAVPLKGYSRYMHVKNVPVGESTFVIAGKKQQLGTPLNTCFLSKIILYIAGLVFLLSLFLRSKIYYVALSVVIALVIASAFACHSIPYIFTAIILVSFLIKRLARRKLSANIEFEIAMAFALGKVLQNKFTNADFDKVRTAFEKLDDQRSKYWILNQLSDAIETADKQAILSQIELHVENALRNAGKPLKYVKRQLSSLRTLSPKLEFLLR
ncbi:alpha/beta fold hydrolase [Candidatus Woesearchaeota archaeon]|nr:alpha/beta fold hydrolase [Candidatus Woesearchaeota archaeon]